MPELLTVTLGSYFSIPWGKLMTGSPARLRFPEPLRVTVSVTASFSFASVAETDDSMVKEPTAPWKSAGLGSGRGLTLTVRGCVVIFRGTVDTDEKKLSKNGSLKKGSLAAVVRSWTRAVISAGSMRISPAIWG
ncbi:MAG: hypothetical protein BWY89_01833 [Bacteroidetes bacterium ADurb.BinA012]|nr:MAG: hypothetical protein BWY89_01833 [Bacteroidetes bacterium ADurb.BinA012]